MAITLAQLNAIPNDPTVMWILAAAMVIGGGISTMCVVRAFSSVKEASSGTRSAVTEMLDFCRDESVRREVVINRICEAHEAVGDKISARVDGLHESLVTHTVATAEKLNAIHDDIRRPIPRKATT